MKCIKCDSEINFGEQMMEWDEMFGEEASTPVAVMIECADCDQSVLVCVDAWEDPQEIKSPFFGDALPTKHENLARKNSWSSKMKEGHKRQIEFFQKKSLRRRGKGKGFSSGFTLIEVLVVIGIIAVLATIVLVAVNPSRH